MKKKNEMPGTKMIDGIKEDHVGTSARYATEAESRAYR
jgi:hypothetical protein